MTKRLTNTQSRTRSKRSDDLLEPEITPEISDIIDYATNIVAAKVRLGKFTRQIGLDLSRTTLIQSCLSVRVITKPADWIPEQVDTDEMHQQEATLSPQDGASNDDILCGFASAIRLGLWHHLLYWRRLPEAQGEGPDIIASFDVSNAPPYSPWNTTNIEFDDAKAARVIAMAWRGHPIAAEVLAEFAKQCHDEGGNFPPNLGQYLVELASGRRAGKLKGSLSKTAQRDFEIACLVHEILRTGIQRSASEYVRGRPAPNAYWVAKRALELNGIHLSRSTVASAFDDYGEIAAELTTDPMDYELVGVDGNVYLNPRTFFPEGYRYTYRQVIPVLQNSQNK